MATVRGCAGCILHNSRGTIYIKDVRDVHIYYDIFQQVEANIYKSSTQVGPESEQSYEEKVRVKLKRKDTRILISWSIHLEGN